MWRVRERSCSQGNSMNTIKRVFRTLRIYRNPFRYLWAKLTKDRERIGMVHLWGGARFKLHMGNSDINSIDEIFGADVYHDFFSKIRRGDMFIDIGANIGIVSVAAGLRGAKIIAFEPNPQVTALLRENILLNNIPATIYEKGIAGRSGKRNFNTLPTMWGGASLCGKSGEAIAIDCVEINDLLNDFDKVDFVKIDVEGGEKEILDIVSDENAKK
jgi:FkbM family methyltransferase